MKTLANTAKPSARMVKISTDEAGQRIDNFLLAQLKGVPKSRIYRMLRKGEVRVNKGRIRQHYRICAGDIIRIPPVRVATRDAPVAEPGSLLWLESAILHEDDNLIVLNKPSGLAVHGGSGISMGAIESMRALRPHQPYLELVHRLDRDTSGCLMIAKRRSVLRVLHEELREGRVRKNYTALAAGKWPARLYEVKARLDKNVRKSGERYVTVSQSGQYASTRFSLQKYYARASLLDVQLETGRTHQIRVHAQHAGHPLACDQRYGDAEFNAYCAGLGLKRLFLHAASLGFSTGRTGRLKIQAPLPEELVAVLDKMAKETDG